MKFIGNDGTVLFRVKRGGEWVWEDIEDDWLVYEDGFHAGPCPQLLRAYRWPVVNHPYWGAVPLEGRVVKA